MNGAVRKHAQMARGTDISVQERRPHGLKVGTIEDKENK
jgi:hypothetical protein